MQEVSDELCLSMLNRVVMLVKISSHGSEVGNLTVVLLGVDCEVWFMGFWILREGSVVRGERREECISMAGLLDERPNYLCCC